MSKKSWVSEEFWDSAIMNISGMFHLISFFALHLFKRNMNIISS